MIIYNQMPQPIRFIEVGVACMTVGFLGQFFPPATHIRTTANTIRAWVYPSSAILGLFGIAIISLGTILCLRNRRRAKLAARPGFEILPPASPPLNPEP